MPKPAERSPDRRRAFEALVVLSHLVDATMERHSHLGGGVGHTFYKVLVLTYDAPGHRIRLKTLADELRFSPSRISHAVKRLEELGLLVKVNSDVPGKSWDAVLTDAGIRVVHKTAPRHMREVREPLFAALNDEEISELADIAEKLIARLDSLDADADN